MKTLSKSMGLIGTNFYIQRGKCIEKYIEKLFYTRVSLTLYKRNNIRNTCKKGKNENAQK